MLKYLYVKLTSKPNDPRGPGSGLEVEKVELRVTAEYVETTNRDDHVRLSVWPRKLLKAQHIESWERAFQKGRVVPMRISEIEEVHQPQQEAETGAADTGA